MPSLPRDVLDSKLDALALTLPGILRDTDGASPMDAFAGIADEILEATGPADHDHVWSRLQCILRDNGLIPGDDEPCSE